MRRDFDFYIAKQTNQILREDPYNFFFFFYQKPVFFCRVGWEIYGSIVYVVRWVTPAWGAPRAEPKQATLFWLKEVHHALVDSGQYKAFGIWAGHTYADLTAFFLTSRIFFIYSLTRRTHCIYIWYFVWKWQTKKCVRIWRKMAHLAPSRQRGRCVERRQARHLWAGQISTTYSQAASSSSSCVVAPIGEDRPWNSSQGCVPCLKCFTTIMVSIFPLFLRLFFFAKFWGY